MSDEPTVRDDLEGLRDDLQELRGALPDRVVVSPDDPESGLAQLVLTILEFVREVLEHQAVSRMESETLTEAEVERLGLALLHLRERMDGLKDTFGLTDEDLRLDLGPLGRLR